VGSIAYVELGDSNGGIVLNVSEGGLSLTAVGVLDVERSHRIRVQPPRSRDWIELSGEFAWVSESKKEAGIRFHELTAEAGDRIRNWISQEASPAEIQRERGRYSKSETPLAVNPNDRLPEPPVLEPGKSHTAAPEDALISSFTPAATAPEIVTMESAPQVALQGPRAGSDKAGGTDNSSKAVERRSHTRCRIKSLVYIELGKSNCGIVANISENGLHLEAAVALIGDHVPLMRFQLPHSRKWIETSGKVVWTSESRRKVGIQFVDLPADEQAQMKEWVSLEASRAQVPGPTESVREKYKSPGQRPIAPGPESQIVRPGASDKGSQTHAQPPVRSAIPASTTLNIKVLGVASEPYTKAPRPAGEAGQKPRASGISGWLTSGLTVTSWRTSAPPIALIAVLSFVVGWFAARQRAGNNITQVAGVTAEATSKSIKRMEPPAMATGAHPSSPDGRGAPRQERLDPPTPANRTASVPVIAEETAGPAGRGAQSPPVNSASKVPSRAGDSVKLAARLFAPSVARPAANVPAPAAKETPSLAPGSSAAYSNQPIMASPSPTPNRPEAAAVVATKPKESATPAPKLPEMTAIPAGSVSVTFPAFPSIRVPPELKSQSSRLGTSLQIGQPISRVEPFYPEAVRKQGIEGTIKVHAIIGRDGAVQSVEVVSGPPLLAPLAMGAIREWHFKQTLLGGQPIETEEDFTVIFRLTNSPVRSN
jgi:outer membrane biosynthesis protein TonB